MARPFEFHIAQALGLNTDQIAAESVNVQFLGTMVQITWGGVLMVDSPVFQDAVNDARKSFEKELEGG